MAVSSQRSKKAIEAENFEQAIKDAAVLVDRVKEDSAKSHCQELMAIAHIGIARSCRDRVDYPEAEKHYDMAMQVFPQGPIAALELADMLQLSPARKASAIPPVSARHRAGRTKPRPGGSPIRCWTTVSGWGRLFFDERQYREAADAFLEVTRLDSGFRYAQAVDLAVESYAKAQASALDDDRQHIIANLKSIIALKPTEDRAYLLLGRIYYDQQDWDDARTMLKQAVANTPARIGPNRALQEALYYLGISQRHLNENEDAAQSFEELVSRDPNNYDALCELAQIRYEQANYAAALDLFDRAQRLDQEKYRAYLGKGETLSKLSEFTEARDNFREVVERDPTNARAQYAIAYSYFLAEKWDEAVREAGKTVDMIDDLSKEQAAQIKDKESILAQSYTLMGNASLTQGKTNLAREQFEKALARMSGYAAALDGIGKTYQAEGRHKAAEEFFLKAIEASPQTPDFYLSLGINWHNYRKNTGEALKYYYKYLELGGTDPNVRVWIRECGGTPPAAAPEKP